MSKVTRSKSKFLIYILLQETNKINRKFFQILNDFFRIHSSGKQGFRDTKAIFCLLGKLPNPHRTLPAASGCASVPDASTAVPAKEKSRSEASPRLQKTFTCACGLHAFCSPRLYAFSSLRSAGHCTGQS